MSLFKNIDLWKDFAAGAYLSEGPSAPMTYDPDPPPPTHYTCIFYTGMGRRGGEMNQREG